MKRTRGPAKEPGVRSDFLSCYLASFDRIPGWFSPDAYFVISAYNQLLADEGLTADVLEIGVYHGLSAVGLAGLRGPRGRFVAVDVFDKPGEHIAGSLVGSRAAFLGNMARFYDDLSFVTTIAARSATLRAADLGSRFSLCHIDGGHTAGDVYGDLKLCAAAVRPGGLVVLDDYSSPAFPGVAEGALRFNLDAPGTLRPVAIGFNKALFQRAPAPFDMNARFFEVFPHLPARRARLWDVSVPLFDTPVRVFFDITRSTPRRLVGSYGEITARIEPSTPSVTSHAGGIVHVPVQVTNLSRRALPFEGAPFGLSYHLLTADRAPLKFDNDRVYFTDALAPGTTRIVNVPVRVPDQPGRYQLEFDIVWEGVLWMKDVGNPTASVVLTAAAAVDTMAIT